MGGDPAVVRVWDGLAVSCPHRQAAVVAVRWEACCWPKACSIMRATAGRLRSQAIRGVRAPLVGWLVGWLSGVRAYQEHAPASVEVLSAACENTTAFVTNTKDLTKHRAQDSCPGGLLYSVLALLGDGSGDSSCTVWRSAVWLLSHHASPSPACALHNKCPASPRQQWWSGGVEQQLCSRRKGALQPQPGLWGASWGHRPGGSVAV